MKEKLNQFMVRDPKGNGKEFVFKYYVDDNENVIVIKRSVGDKFQ